VGRTRPEGCVLLFDMRGGNRGVPNTQNMPTWACLGCSAVGRGSGRRQTCTRACFACLGCGVGRKTSGRVFCVPCRCRSSVVGVGPSFNAKGGGGYGAVGVVW